MLPEKPWRLSDTGTPPPGSEPGDPCQAPGASPGPAPRLGRGRQACRTASPRPRNCPSPASAVAGPVQPAVSLLPKAPTPYAGLWEQRPWRWTGTIPSDSGYQVWVPGLFTPPEQPSEPGDQVGGGRGGGEGRSQQSTLTAYKAPHGLGVIMAALPEWRGAVGGAGHLYQMDPHADGSWGLGGWAGI